MSLNPNAGVDDELYALWWIATLTCVTRSMHEDSGWKNAKKGYMLVIIMLTMMMMMILMTTLMVISMMWMNMIEAMMMTIMTVFLKTKSGLISRGFNQFKAGLK